MTRRFMIEPPILQRKMKTALISSHSVPSGEGVNGIPTGKPFYGILRAYMPVKGADLTVKVEKR